MSPTLRTRLQTPQQPRVLLVHRSTLFQEYVDQLHDQRITQLVQRNDVSVARWRSSHERQLRAIDAVIELFAKAPLSLSVIERAALDQSATQDRDLLVVVGGDGTVLHASHFALELPLLGINSDPLTSTGFLCSARADEAEDVLREYLEGELVLRSLHRLRLSLDAETVTVPVLNDILYTHECPAATSKYIIELGEQSEVQQSSGIWVCTAAGSTAAMSSAGGEPMSLDEQRLQFRVREPATRGKAALSLTHGYIPANTHLRLVSKMLRGMVYLDGPHVALPIELGHRLDLCSHPHPLRQVRRP